MSFNQNGFNLQSLIGSQNSGLFASQSSDYDGGDNLGAFSGGSDCCPPPRSCYARGHTSSRRSQSRSRRTGCSASRTDRRMSRACGSKGLGSASGPALHASARVRGQGQGLGSRPSRRGREPAVVVRHVVLQRVGAQLQPVRHVLFEPRHQECADQHLKVRKRL